MKQWRVKKRKLEIIKYAGRFKDWPAQVQTVCYNSFEIEIAAIVPSATAVVICL